MSKKPFRFSLIKRQPDEPTIVLASDFNSRPIPWNEIIEVIEVHYDKLEELTAKVKRYEEALEFYANPDTYGQDDVSRTTGNKQFDIVCFDSDRNFKKGIDMSGKRARAALNQGES